MEDVIFCWKRFYSAFFYWKMMGKGRDKSAIFVSYSCYFNVGEKEFLDSLKFFGRTREKGDTG